MSLKTAYTARELAELHLDGLPSTEFRIREFAKRSGWPVAGKVGKAALYRLPAEYQVQLHEVLSSPSDNAAPPATTSKSDLRLNARALIVTEFKAHVRRSGLPLTKAEPGFMALYAAQRTSGAEHPFPRWLFNVYPSFSVSSLRNWRGKAADPRALRDGYGNRRGQSILARAEGGAVASAIAAIICERQLLAAGHIRDLIRMDFGTVLQLEGREVPLPKIRAFERYIEGWKRDNPELLERAVNPDGWKNKYMLALGKADADIHRLNQRWEIDASPMDVMCTDGRHLIYALIDIWSRRLMIHVSRTATTEGSLQLVRKAIMAWGVPDEIKTDNGSDFKSFRFRSALGSNGLNVPLTVSGPFQPWKKAFVERVIGTFQHSFAATQPGFVGHSVADRKKIEGVKSFADNLGSGTEAKFQVALTHSELQERIDTWVAGFYHQQPHSGLGGQTPFARAASSTVKPRMVADVRALDILLAPVAGHRRVGKKGLRIEGGRFWHETLGLYMGKDVYVRHDPADMGRVYVFDMDEKFICEAQDFTRLGADRATAASAAKAAQRKAINEQFAQVRKTVRAEYSAEKMAEKFFSDQARAAAKVTTFPRQTETYTTPSLDEAARAVTKERIAPCRTAEQNARQEAFVEDYENFQRKSAQRQKSNVERWKDRARDIEARLEAGNPVSEVDAAWLATMKTESWFQAWKNLEDYKAAMTEGQ
ncbi:MAG: DDE-type integrase/transposase/recombinase [Alphaproteobacteria bacterium]|nr:DDE-type integrase/transposase/recombinase [Alphaproteobacteria bacterium]